MICFPLFAYPFPAAEAGVCEQGVCRQAELLVIVDLLLLVIVSGVCGERALAGSFQIGARADAAFFLKGFAEGMNAGEAAAERDLRDVIFAAAEQLLSFFQPVVLDIGVQGHTEIRLKQLGEKLGETPAASPMTVFSRFSL